MSTPRSGRTRTEELRSFKSAALSDANRHMVRRVQGSIRAEQEWEFFCECGAEACYEQVFLTLDAYIAVREHGRAVLAPDHRVSQVGRARELRLEAEALRRQSDHQVKRAKRNLRDRPDT
jgi:hypothetical protein